MLGYSVVGEDWKARTTRFTSSSHVCLTRADGFPLLARLSRHSVSSPRFSSSARPPRGLSLCSTAQNTNAHNNTNNNNVNNNNNNNNNINDTNAPNNTNNNQHNIKNNNNNSLLRDLTQRQIASRCVASSRVASRRVATSNIAS